MEQEQLQQLIQDFLSRLKLLVEKADKLFIMATTGLIGSGRTTVAKMMVAKLSGVVLVKSDSARFLLKEAGLPWGDNVRQILKGAALDLLSKGYGVIFDGNAADTEDRKNISEIANERKRARYDDSSWVSSFDDFRVNTTEKILKNLEERLKLHKELKSSDIPNLLGEIDNNGSPEELEKQVAKLLAQI